MKTKASRVLIVDDMSVNRMVISSLLATNGVFSDQAESGTECLSLCKKKKYDLILLDHHMPEPDGVDTLLALKELFAERGRSIPVVCHTTADGAKNIKLYKAAGFADVLIKPIDPMQLSELVMTYLPEEDKLITAENSMAGPEDTLPQNALSDNVEEIEKLPLWLKTVPHIDLVSGVANSGDAEDYLYSLYIFHSSIEEKVDEIKTYYDNDDWTMYRLSMHSLKSMARLIGARLLVESAAALEASAESGNIKYIRKNTLELHASYRKYSNYLSPLKDDETIRQIRLEEIKKQKEAVPAESPDNHKKTILFVYAHPGIVTKGIEKGLTDSGFSVISIPEEPAAIIAHRQEADIAVYYPSIADGSNIELTINLLSELCLDDAKLLCVTGDPSDLALAMSSNGAQRISGTYPRPLNKELFLKDMEYFSGLLDEYRRKKSLFIVDDDPNYLQVISHWLTDTYNVSCFNNGRDLLDGLSAAKPDLLLLDYEMPEMNGYDVIRSIRKDPEKQKIPIIFLTEKNDREHIFRILQFKPDGYLLKTTQKEPLLDTLRRFYSESLFKSSVRGFSEPVSPS